MIEFPEDLKPMRYAEPLDFGNLVKRNDVPFEILYEGEYRGVKFRITNNRGMNPCCYIKVPDDMLYDQSICGCDIDAWYNDLFDVHGGITWFGRFEPFRGCMKDDDEPDCIGWDYGHLGDYCPSTSSFGGGSFFGDDHMWSTEELYVECIDVIDKALNSSMYEK